MRPRSLTCLGGELTEYAAGRLPEPRRRAWDRHLVACASCARAVEDERRLQALLVHDTPSMPTTLRGALLALSMPTAVAAPAPPRPAGTDLAPLATLAPTAPPVHRSVLRSALVAAGAASLTAAAAWSLAAGTDPAGPPAPHPAAGAAATPGPSGAAAPGMAGSTSALAVSILGPLSPTVEPRGYRRAQSTP